MIRAGGEGGAGSRKQAHKNGGRNIHSEWCALKHTNGIYYEGYVLWIYTGVCRRIFEAEGGMERELAKRENEMGSPVDKTVWARDEMSFREDIKTLCI